MKLCIQKSNNMMAIVAVLTICFMVSSCEMTSEQITREYGWFNFVISDIDTTQNVVDMSFLNENEAGETGFIAVANGHFVTGAGTPIRFFGDNLTFGGCFLEKETSIVLAARLRKLGYNVIRFHHMDNRSAPGGIWDEEREKFDPEQLEKLDWLIFQLKKNGIYSNLNLHVSRVYPGVDYGENRSFVYGKRIDHFYRPYIDMQKEYAKMLLTHRNPYTGNTYANEPAVGFVEINNENSILSRWTALSDLTGNHRAALASKWRDWLNDNGKAGSGWDIYKIIDQFETESTAEQKEMFWKFLVETELSYVKEMIEYIKNDIGIKMPISESQASYSGMAGVYREAKYADFIDMHAYWEHPRWLDRAWDRNNWYIVNSSMVSDKKGGTLRRFVQHRVKGMPLTISEYDHPAPSFYSAEMYPMMNSVAAFQDWDGIYHFNYSPNQKIGEINGYFSSSGHPLKQVFIPVGAILFRMPTIAAGPSVVTMSVPENDVINQLTAFDKKQNINAQHTDYVWKKAGGSDALTLLKRTEVEFDGDELTLSGEVPQTEGPWVSETGELRWENRDSLNAVFSIDAPAAKAAVGYIGGKSIEVGNVTIAMDTIPDNWGVVTLTSLDGKSLNEAANILLVAAGKAENTGMGWNEERNSMGTEWGSSPTIAEGLPVKITLRDMDRLKMFALDSAGNRGNEIRVLKRRGNQEIHIGAQHKTLWYLLTKE
ncbi:MAG: hypothetical protein KAR17_06765 [Cyclobacteriaceae bacterium]|nr:hypothetical protein [Cyclobacteriaceae bacterium]